MTPHPAQPLLLPGLLALGLCLAGTTPAAAQAQDLPPGMIEAEVLGGWQTESGNRMAALRIALDDGWKTYWRAPGDAGIPPQFTWVGSGNVASVRVHWPRPQVFDLNGMRSVGYLRELILPIEITPTDPSQPIELSAGVEFGICHDVCVPVSVDLSADLSGPGAPDAAIRAALTAQPDPRPGQARCRIEPIRDGMRVTAEIDLPPLGPDEVTLFELRGAPVWISDSVSRREGARLVSMAEFVPGNAQPFDLNPADLTITVLSAGNAIEINGCPG